MRVAGGVIRPTSCNIVKVSDHLLVEKKCGNSYSVRLNTCLRGTNSCKPLKGTGSGRCGIATQTTKLGDKWMEYQGIKNWEGLLDPLDEDLRREILRYGDFVEAAYCSFEFDTSSQSYAKCRFSKTKVLKQCGLGKSGYKVTKNLRATCGIQLPRWIHRAPSWLSMQSSWIGYVAVCNDKEQIARLGRRDVVIAYRGTATCLEWLENLRATLTYLPGDMEDNIDGPRVQSGFLSMYTSSTTTHPSLQYLVREEISRILQRYPDEPLSITITGHSLGAALATLTAYDITNTFDHSPLVTVVSFGGPRVGDKSFRCKLEKSGTRILRIVNSDDLITKVPGFVIQNDAMEDKGEVQVAGLPRWFHKHVENKLGSYADVGKELRLSSKESPYLSKGNVATCHDLKTYLHLVDGFVSSTCPFKATAKRMLSSTQHEEHLLFR